jgi:glycosyltransferase involved in cell wall biosynthesis
MGIKLVELGNCRTLFLLKKIIDYLVNVSTRYEQIYYVSCQYYVNLVSMLVAMILKPRYRNIRFINSERNHFEEFRVNGGWKNRVVFFLVPILYRFADVIVANSRQTADDLAKLVGREVYCVYNPTINPRIESLRHEPVQEEWFKKDTRPCVLGVGRLSVQKDFSTLLKAFKLACDKMSLRLVLLGEGELRQQLETEIDNLGLTAEVYLPGFVDNPYKFLAESDVFVLSSKYEGLPNVLIEAVHLGVPCVSTRCKSGPAEILLDGEGGLLVPVGDSKAMADSILQVLENPQQAKSRARIAAMSINRFSYDAVIQEFEKVINR